MAPEQVPIKTFDPLLRDSFYWGVLVRVEEPSGIHWQLSERAEDRLNEIATESRAFSAERMVFLDRRCGECGLRLLTRLHDARYVCDACWSTLNQSATTVAASTTPVSVPANDVSTPLREHRWVPPWRQRTA